MLLNFVLQFLPPEDRAPWLTKAFEQTTDDGMVIVSEKVAGDPFDDETHLAWKKANGYSDLEISSKRTALENVMKIDSEGDHIARFRAAGFEDVRPWFRCLNWASFVARKAPG